MQIKHFLKAKKTKRFITSLKFAYSLLEYVSGIVVPILFKTQQILQCNVLHQKPTPPDANDITSHVYLFRQYSWPGVMEHFSQASHTWYNLHG